MFINPEACTQPGFSSLTRAREKGLRHLSAWTWALEGLRVGSGETIRKVGVGGTGSGLGFPWCLIQGCVLGVIASHLLSLLQSDQGRGHISGGRSEAQKC